MTIDVIHLEESTEPPVARSSGPIAVVAWFIAARSDELRDAGPIARAVNGTPVVLYRDAARRVVAMEDRCPHKNVALSLGRVCGDTLQCRYHGWRFDPAGVVVEVPCHAPTERPPACRVRTFRAVEQDDWIWVHLGDPAVAASAPSPPRYEQSVRYGWFELQNVIHAPVDLILENGLDCSHTGFAHEGLFRSAPTQFIRARIEETATGVRVETQGEDAADAKDVRSLLGRKRTIRHVDEVILPHTLKVDYWIGDVTHVVTILVCTPEDGMRTRVYTRMGVSDGWLTPLVTRYVRWITRKVVAQDIAILNSQAARIREFGRREFRGVTADLPAAWLQRAYRRFAEGRYPGEPLRSRDVVYKL
jgi:phenylpropionate dioxygenase-like ring-hydroxylating dioxygenase large terminal subunit